MVYETINDKHSLGLKGVERSLRSGLPQWHFGYIYIYIYIHIQERREKNNLPFIWFNITSAFKGHDSEKGLHKPANVFH